MTLYEVDSRDVQKNGGVKKVPTKICLPVQVVFGKSKRGIVPKADVGRPRHVLKRHITSGKRRRET
jgi:hypothetical protein